MTNIEIGRSIALVVFYAFCGQIAYDIYKGKVNKFKLSLAIFFLSFGLATAEVLPAVPERDNAVTLTTSGLARFTESAKAYADMLCFAGAIQQDKWFPMSITANGRVSAIWLKVQSGCSRFDTFNFNFDNPANTWQHSKL